MKRKNSESNRKFILIAISSILFLAVMIASLAFVSGNRASISVNNQGSFDPQVITNLTSVPAISDDVTTEVQQVAQMLTDCPAYIPARRAQMQQHIAWLLNPSELPPTMILALGGNPIGRLIFGMSTYTSIEWKLQERPNPSCLLDIGRKLNELLEQTGEEPFPEFN